mgnify:CR=1 FL=1
MNEVVINVFVSRHLGLVAVATNRTVVSSTKP